MAVGLSKHAARHHEQFLPLHGLFRKGLAGTAGRLWIEVERTTRLHEPVVVLQARHQLVSLAAALGQRQIHRAVERGNRRPLAHLRCTDERVLLQHGAGVHDRLRSVHPADPPAGHGVRLREAVDHDHRLGVQGRGGEGGVVAIRTVEFVADQRDAARLRQLRQAANRVGIDHHAGGIGGRVEQDRASGWSHRRRDPIDIDSEGR